MYSLIFQQRGIFNLDGIKLISYTYGVGDNGMFLLAFDMASI